MGGEKAETSGLSSHPGLRHDGAETGGVIPALAEVRFRYVAVAMVIGLTIWGWLDVRERGQTHPNHADFHRTDFTVYTEAGAAFFDGREPYEVTNPRHWYYLYPPLFALLVSPLAALDFKSQVVVWYVISLGLAFGCYSESRHLWTLLVASDSGEADAGRNAAFRIGACAGLTVLLPTLECLQRGQVGIALVYTLLLGFRLSLGGRSWPIWCLGGVVLGWPIVVKLIPALPVAVLLLQRWAAALAPSRSPRALSQATTVTLGLALGVFLFTFAIPAACIGWSQNLHHLRTWSRKVATSPDMGREVFVEVDNDSNQSFSNAAHLLAARIRNRASAGANSVTDQVAHRQWLAAVTAISAAACRLHHRRVGAGCSGDYTGPADRRRVGGGAAGRCAGSGRDLWLGLPGDRLDFPGGLESLLHALATVRPTSASLVDAAGPVESSDSPCHGSRGVDLGALLGEALVRAVRAVGPRHAGVVLGRRQPVDSDRFLYPALPSRETGHHLLPRNQAQGVIARWL